MEQGPSTQSNPSSAGQLRPAQGGAASGPPETPPSRSDTGAAADTDIFNSLGIRNIALPEFRELSQLIVDNFGIKIGENKTTLITGRVYPMLEKYGFTTHREYIEALKNDPTGKLLSELANRISTNHTSFFREEAHFQLMRDKILPDLIRRKTASGNCDLRVWCAACATGEEAYSILFTLLKFFLLDYANWRAGVLATDISASALEQAKHGKYTRQRLEPVPRDILGQYFNQLDADNYEVKNEFRKEVTFRRLNLINDTYPFKQRFDIIFCRNVMIYFSRTVRTRLLTRLCDWLMPGGYLFIGHSESLVGSHTAYDYIAPAVYRRPE